jgi:hypothetical protein
MGFGCDRLNDLVGGRLSVAARVYHTQVDQISIRRLLNIH